MYQLWDTNVFVGIANGLIVGKPTLELPVAVCPATIAELFVGSKESEEKRISALRVVAKRARIMLPNVGTHIRYLFKGVSDQALERETMGLWASVVEVAGSGSFSRVQGDVANFERIKATAEQQIQARTMRSKEAMRKAFAILPGKKRHVAEKILRMPATTFPPLFRLICFIEGREISRDEPIEFEKITAVYETFDFYLNMYFRYVEIESVERQDSRETDKNDFSDLAQLIYVQLAHGVKWITNDKKWKEYAKSLGVDGVVLNSKEAFEN